jgi:phage tail protein X
MSSTYTTIAGDRWDEISYKVYGSSYHVDKLIEANVGHRYTVRFDSGVVLTCPEIPEAIPRYLPPWSS